MIKELDKKTLKQLYVEKGKTILEVARIVNCSPQTVRRRCKQFGIPVREPRSEKCDINEATLKRLYITEQKSLNEIARMFGRSYTFVRNRCINYRIKLRPINYKKIKFNKSDILKLYVQEDKTPREIAQIFKCTPNTVRKRFRKYGILLKDKRIKGLEKAQLQKLYVNEGKSLKEIANLIGCSHETVRKRCNQHGIQLRRMGSKIPGLDKSTLLKLFVKEGKSLSKIAEMFSCSPYTVRDRCREYGIKTSVGRPKKIKK